MSLSSNGLETIVANKRNKSFLDINALFGFTYQGAWSTSHASNIAGISIHVATFLPLIRQSPLSSRKLGNDDNHATDT